MTATITVTSIDPTRNIGDRDDDEKHLCKIWADTYNVDQVRGLVKNAEYICKVCGRAAAKEENLCDPVRI